MIQCLRQLREPATSGASIADPARAGGLVDSTLLPFRVPGKQLRVVLKISLVHLSRVSDNGSGVARHDVERGDVSPDYASRRDQRPVADGHAREHEDPGPDKHVPAQGDRLQLVSLFLLLGAFEVVTAVKPYRDMRAVSEKARPGADLGALPDSQPGAAVQHGVVPDVNVVLDKDILRPVYERGAADPCIDTVCARSFRVAADHPGGGVLAPVDIQSCANSFRHTHDATSVRSRFPRVSLSRRR